jgi:para-aminobenzoate synthetase/4-amino-4-deoxychorismate lyase
VTLAELATAPSFALLGPGFTGGGWLLVAPLDPEGPEPRIAYAPYERAGHEAFRFGGPARRLAEAGPADLAAARAEALPPWCLDETGHAEAVRAIREEIAAGDVYQVNLTLRARRPDLPGAALFAALCRREVPRFAAWVRLPGGEEFVSASPELFFAVSGRRVRVEPMKGTAPPDRADRLLASAKDRAELAMITDLLRNDLTRVCRPRTVRCVCERRLLRLPYAVQAVSDVTGELPPGVGPLEVLDALHPSGSVTGAPKRAAMARIARLERSPRGAYCGALGLIEGDRAVFSVLIRTAERRDGGWVGGVGGGIVWESEAEAELEEARLKLGGLS